MIGLSRCTRGTTEEMCLMIGLSRCTRGTTEEMAGNQVVCRGDGRPRGTKKYLSQTKIFILISLRLDGVIGKPLIFQT